MSLQGSGFESYEFKGKPRSFVNVVLTQNGARVTVNAAVDASSTDLYWEYRPATNEVARITRLIPQTRDAGTFDAEKYGNAAGLTTGIKVELVRGTGAGATVLLAVTDPLVPIKNNADWALNCFDWTPLDIGTGDNYGKARWTFSQSGHFLEIFGAQSEALRVTLRDNLEALVSERYMAQGAKVTL